jgi:tetratricopeptide (TPR) repeat protein
MVHRHPAVALAAALVFAFGSGIEGAAPPGMLKQVEFLIGKGEHARALENLEEFLKSNPRDAHGRFLKGVILSEQKKTHEAIRVYTDLTHDHPDLPEPYNNLAVLHASLGQYDPARLALEMAIRVKPDYAVAHENLGDIYARMAAQAYEKAAKLDPRNKSVPLKLKQVTEMLSSIHK